MIRDIFHKRYRELAFYFPNNMGGGEIVPEYVEAFFKQIAHILYYDIKPILNNSTEIFFKIQETFARELGVGGIGKGNSYEEKCLNYLSITYNVWSVNDDVSEYIKKKISLIEISFGIIQEELEIKSRNDSISIFNSAVEELNQRFKSAKLGFYYQNKMIHTYTDNLTQKNILEPYWGILKNPKWQLVDSDIREANEGFINNKNDSALFAMRGLESLIKIINNDLGLVTGYEKGASNYIDNLSSKKNQFLEKWEAEALKLLFKEIRNPLVHGISNEKQIELKYYQTRWVIDTCLVWIKSLICRLK